MDAEVPSATLIVWLGFGLGAVFGFVGNKTNFCTMGAVSDVVNMSDELWVVQGDDVIAVWDILARGKRV